MRRRRFLHAAALGGAAALLGLRPDGAAGVAAAAACPAEHAGTLDELLFVYDQAAAPHLLREMVEILRHAPPDARVRVLVSRSLADSARTRLAAHGLARAELLVSDEEGVSGDWGRDIFQLGRDPDGGPVVGVPWHKAATRRTDLDRGLRQLEPLATPDRAVRQVPAAFEGGNLMFDRLDGRCVLLAGTTIAVETRALYRAFYGSDPGDEGTARILRDGLGADEVLWLGPRSARGLARQARYGFHIDMGLTLVAPQVAVAARCAPERLTADDHRRVLRREAERTLAALERREAAGLPWPEGLDLPRAAGPREAHLESVLETERARLAEVADEWEDTAVRLADRGYAVHRLDADPRRVRRFQSHTNAVVTRDRLLMPLFPSRERVHAWLLRGDAGRDQVDVALGPADSEFALAGDNLEAYRLFGRLHPNVRTVRDYFYLASGNVHCVVGRLS